MRDDERDDLSGPERERLAALPRERRPPPELEEQVVAALRERGLIAGGVRWRRMLAVAAAFVIAVPVAYLYGVRSGVRQASASPAGGAAYALMVFDPAAQAMPPERVASAVADAAAWAAELAESGTLVAAEKLRDEGDRLVLEGGEVRIAADFPPPGDDLVLGGFFLIRAADDEEARRIAAACPLLRYGSTIEVRAFEEI